MKKKYLFLLLGVAAALLLSGCSQQNQLGYIGRQAAEALALEASGLSGPNAEITSCTLENKNGTDYYRITFALNGAEYRCDVDALTGTVIELRDPDGNILELSGAASEKTPADSSDDPSSETSGDPSGQPSAGSPASESSAGSSGKAPGSTGGSSGGNSVGDTSSGSVGNSGGSGQTSPPKDSGSSAGTSGSGNGTGGSSPSSGSFISESRAKEIALAQVPGATAAHIREFEVDYDDGHLEYEGVIVYKGMEYEFEIDGYSGAIRDWDVEAEDD